VYIKTSRQAWENTWKQITRLLEQIELKMRPSNGGWNQINHQGFFRIDSGGRGMQAPTAKPGRMNR